MDGDKETHHHADDTFILYCLYTPERKKRSFSSISGSLKKKNMKTQEKQVNSNSYAPRLFDSVCLLLLKRSWKIPYKSGIHILRPNLTPSL